MLQANFLLDGSKMLARMPRKAVSTPSPEADGTLGGLSIWVPTLSTGGGWKWVIISKLRVILSKLSHSVMILLTTFKSFFQFLLLKKKNAPKPMQNITYQYC